MQFKNPKSVLLILLPPSTLRFRHVVTDCSQLKMMVRIYIEFHENEPSVWKLEMGTHRQHGDLTDLFSGLWWKVD